MSHFHVSRYQTHLLVHTITGSVDRRVAFYMHSEASIKGDLLPMFQNLFNGEFQLFKFNFGIITLLPKKEEAVRIEQIRPICLLNVSFKIFIKVGTNRLTMIAHIVV